MAKIGISIRRLFLKSLNFTPELLAKTQEEADFQNVSIGTLLRDAVEKHLNDLKQAREEAKEAELKEYATLLLRAHFAEDRNECLTEEVIRSIGKNQSRT
jgi:hypothetical protein